MRTFWRPANEPNAALQAVRGTVVGHDGLVRCTNADCNDELHEGSAVGAVVYRQSDDAQWTVGRLYGGPCRPSHVRYPMVGTETTSSTPDSGHSRTSSSRIISSRPSRPRSRLRRHRAKAANA